MKKNCFRGGKYHHRTHALIQEKVQYHALALVVTDEQHRFGVKAERGADHQRKCPCMFWS